jgi:hypothetical protein
MLGRWAALAENKGAYNNITYFFTGNSFWLPGAFAPGFLGSKFFFSKLFKKFRKKSCTYLTMARTPF